MIPGRRAEGIEFPENFKPGFIDIGSELFENGRGDAISFPQQTEQNVFGANVSVIEVLGILGGKSENFLYPRGVGNVADRC